MPTLMSWQINEDPSNQHENNQKFYDEKRNSSLSIKDIQWKLRRHHDQNSQ